MENEIITGDLDRKVAPVTPRSQSVYDEVWASDGYLVTDWTERPEHVPQAGIE